MYKKAVLINISNRLVGMTGNLILLLLVATYTTKTMQGFYYTFTSLLVLQFLVELGLGTAVIQTISHATTSMEKEAYIAFYLRWYKIAATLLILILIPAILVFEKEYLDVIGYQEAIIIPWVILSVMTGVNLYLNGWFAILEGLGEINRVSKIRALQTSFGFAIAGLAVYAGGNLYSLSLLSATQCIIGILSLRVRTVNPIINLGRAASVEKVDWRKNIWPLQWRVAISWISGFFIFYFFTPMIMKTDGPVAAGQLGMSLQLMQAINSLSNVWISTEFTIYGDLLSRKKVMDMEALFWSNFKKATLTLIFLVVIVSILLYLLQASNLRGRILPSDHLILLAFVCFSNHIFFTMNYYVRSYKQDSFWALSFVNAIITTVFCLVYVPQYGTIGVVLIYAAMSITFGLMIGLPYFMHIRNRLISSLDRSA